MQPHAFETSPALNERRGNYKPVIRLAQALSPYSIEFDPSPIEVPLRGWHRSTGGTTI